MAYPNLTIVETRVDDENMTIFNVSHTNGTYLTFTIDGSPDEVAAVKRGWIYKRRLKHYNDNGTMKGY